MKDSVTRNMNKFHPDFGKVKRDATPRDRFKSPIEGCATVTIRIKSHLEQKYGLKGSEQLDSLLK